MSYRKKVGLALLCIVILVGLNLARYGITNLSAAQDFGQFMLDASQAGIEATAIQPQSRQTGAGIFNQQKTNQTDGGGFRPIGTGCPNGKQQRPDGWCPPLQRPGVDGRIERQPAGFRGSWPEGYIPNGSVVPVDSNGNYRQLKAGEEGSFPEGSIYNDRNRGIQ